MVLKGKWMNGYAYGIRIPPSVFNIVIKKSPKVPYTYMWLAMDSTCKYGWYEDTTTRWPWLINGKWIA